MGREGWFDETLSFYDQYLKGSGPAVAYPDYAIEDTTGAWRAQDTWPVVDRSVTLPLGGGSYVDDGADADLAPPRRRARATSASSRGPSRSTSPSGSPAPRGSP